MHKPLSRTKLGLNATGSIGLGLLLLGAAASGCGDDSSGGGGSAGSAGTSTSTSGSGGSSSGGNSSGMGGSAAGMSGSTAGAAGSTAGGAGGSTAGAGGSTSGAGGSVATAGSSGSGGSGGAGPEAKMCEKATGAVPTFKRVAASDKSIPGAVGVVGNPESPDVIYVPQHFTGDVRVVQGGKLLDAPLLNVDVRENPPGREQGLLGIAIHPDFKTNHLLYVYYSAADPQGQSTIDEFELTDATHATKKRSVYTVAHSHQFHNGGAIQFGADKWLYISVGDNQADCGPTCAQMADGNYGRIKKIDVAAQDPESTAKTFANGLRNPWRWSFDPLTFDITIGDVGDGGDASEKLFFASKAAADGKNWAWGNGMGDGRNPAGTLTTLASDGAAIIGGVVYRGSNPKMAGACGLIFFGHLKGNVYTIKTDGQDKQQRAPLSGTNDLGSFGVDANGEIYQTYLGGQVFRIDAE
jgi:hypothetical protein